MQRVAVFMALVMAMPMDALAQKAATPEKPNMFPTMAACQAALASGNFDYYVPKFYGLKSREPVDGVNRVVVPLESDLCVHMQVVGGRRFVVQKEGTLFRAHRLEDGLLSLYARDDCGNRMYDVVFPAPVRPVVEAEPEPAPVRAAPVYGPPPPVERMVYREREHERKRGGKKWPWVLAAGLVAGGGYAMYYYWPCPPGTQRK